MLNCRRNENAAWFHNYKIPKACFLPIQFFPTLGYYDDIIDIRIAEGRKIFADGQRELVRGEIYPNKKWGDDVEVLYGAIHGKLGNHWIGLAVHLKNRIITLYQCGHPMEIETLNVPQIKELAVLIPALIMETSGEEVIKEDVVPFKVEIAKGMPKTNSRFNCGLFVLKMLECHSLKIEDMSKISDDNAVELRRNLACEILNQFVDENLGQ